MGMNRPPDGIGQPEGAEPRGVDDDEELQEAGPRGDEGSQHRRRQVARSGDHSVHRQGRKICNRGRGAQGGLHLPEGLIDAPRGAGSRRRRQRRRKVQGASTHRTPEGQGTGGPHGGTASLALPRRANAEGAAGAGRPLGQDFRLLPAAHGAPAALRPGARSHGGGGVGGIHELGGEEAEVALEEGGEVPEVSRRTYLRGASRVDASNPSAGIEALAQRPAVKRRIIMMVDASETVASPPFHLASYGHDACPQSLHLHMAL
jgi:hypothetical protein